MPHLFEIGRHEIFLLYFLNIALTMSQYRSRVMYRRAFYG
jgi:hypothetical protein